MRQQSSPPAAIAKYLLLAALTNRNTRKSATITFIASRIAREYLHNREYYHDMFKFNVCNGFATDKVHDKVSYTDMPPHERERVRKLYDLFEDKSTEQIFKMLGTVPTSGNKYSPIEAKWAYTYYKKYRHWNYLKENEVSLNEIIKPLNPADLPEYISIF